MIVLYVYLKSGKGEVMLISGYTLVKPPTTKFIENQLIQITVISRELEKMSFIKGKVTFVGDAGVGKTTLIHKFVDDNSEVTPTLGVFSYQTLVKIDEKEVPLDVWDTAGQENYRCLIPMYVRGSQVVVIVFDLSNSESYGNVEGWLEYVNSNSSIDNIFLVGNKCDLERKIARDAPYEFAESHNLKYTEVSAYTGQGVDLLFCHIAKVVDNIEERTAPISNPLIEKQETPCC